jgi:hypothetical protein
LDCSCSNLSLGIFLEFLGFSEYFWCLENIFWTSWNLFFTENNFGKKLRPSYSTWAEPEGPTQSTSAQPPIRSSPSAGLAMPIGQPEAMASTAPPPPFPWCARQGTSRPVPYKGWPSVHPRPRAPAAPAASRPAPSSRTTASCYRSCRPSRAPPRRFIVVVLPRSNPTPQVMNPCMYPSFFIPLSLVSTSFYAHMYH